ncbi:MAG: hypothetical protein ACYDFT_07325, partial [Thermoplasmata archaeon]
MMRTLGPATPVGWCGAFALVVVFGLLAGSIVNLSAGPAGTERTAPVGSSGLHAAGAAGSHKLAFPIPLPPRAYPKARLLPPASVYVYAFHGSEPAPFG